MDYDAGAAAAADTAAAGGSGMLQQKKAMGMHCPRRRGNLLPELVAPCNDQFGEVHSVCFKFYLVSSEGALLQIDSF